MRRSNKLPLLISLESFGGKATIVATQSFVGIGTAKGH